MTDRLHIDPRYNREIALFMEELSDLDRSFDRSETIECQERSCDASRSWVQGCPIFILILPYLSSLHEAAHMISILILSPRDCFTVLSSLRDESQARTNCIITVYKAAFL